MESLSGYSHHEAAAGAVNYSHVIVRIQRKVYHILSRVADAGRDYSGRTNTIAHHLALTTAEVAGFPDGPASLFFDDEFWIDSWQDEPHELDWGRLPAPYFECEGDFSTWQAVFGDSGWAGIPGRAAACGLKPVSIIVPDGRDTMALLREAFQLVPPDRRWKLCFSTYFSRAAPGTDCHWKFILDGTQQARRMRARSGSNVVDYAASGKRPPGDDPFVKAAREGRPQDVYDLAEREKRHRAVIPERPAVSNGDEVSDGVSVGSRRRRRPVAQSHPVSRRAASPFEFDEADDAESGSAVAETAESDREWKSFARKLGVWVVFGLLAGIGALLVFVVIRELS